MKITAHKVLTADERENRYAIATTYAREIRIDTDRAEIHARIKHYKSAGWNWDISVFPKTGEPHLHHGSFESSRTWCRKEFFRAVRFTLGLCEMKAPARRKAA